MLAFYVMTAVIKFDPPPPPQPKNSKNYRYSTKSIFSNHFPGGVMSMIYKLTYWEQYLVFFVMGVEDLSIYQWWRQLPSKPTFQLMNSTYWWHLKVKCSFSFNLGKSLSLLSLTILRSNFIFSYSLHWNQSNAAAGSLP